MAIGSRSMRVRLALLLVSLLASVPLTDAWAASPDSKTYAVYAGRRMPLAEVRHNHCHDGKAPEIRCFASADQRDVDIHEIETTGGDPRKQAVEGSAITGVYYVVFYEHADYGGASFMASVSYPNLGSIGWNDAVSSFKSLNGQRPKWWEHSDYGGSAWHWASGAQVPNVGSAANDRFSSVRNVP
jgi:hypothetical protein